MFIFGTLNLSVRQSEYSICKPDVKAAIMPKAYDLDHLKSH